MQPLSFFCILWADVLQFLVGMLKQTTRHIIDLYKAEVLHVSVHHFTMPKICMTIQNKALLPHNHIREEMHWFWLRTVLLNLILHLRTEQLAVLKCNYFFTRSALLNWTVHGLSLYLSIQIQYQEWPTEVIILTIKCFKTTNLYFHPDSESFVSLISSLWLCPQSTQSTQCVLTHASPQCPSLSRLMATVSLLSPLTNNKKQNKKLLLY